MSEEASVYQIEQEHEQFESRFHSADLFTALAKAQAEIVGAKKDSENPFFKSSYADLAACWDACREALTKHGLCIIQLPQRSSAETVTLQTILGHTSGQSISSTFTMPSGDTPQAYGSTLTYARRYALSAMVGLAQIDDDAEGAMNRNPPKPRLISQKQVDTLMDLIIETGSDLDGFLKWAKIDRVENMPVSKFSTAIKRLEEKKDAGNASASGKQAVLDTGDNPGEPGNRD